MEFGTFQHLAGLFEAGLTNAVTALTPERAFIAYLGRNADNQKYPTVYATQRFSMSGLYTDEDISTEVVRKTMRDGESQLIVDAISTPGLTNRTSVILSGLRSVLTVPLRLSNGMTVGMIYADNRVKAGAFKKEHQELLIVTAEELVKQIPVVEAEMRARPEKQAVKTPLADIRSRTLNQAEKGHYTEALGAIEAWICGRDEGEELGIAFGVKGRILQQMGQMIGSFEATATAVYLLGQYSNKSEHYALMLNNLAGLHVTLENLNRAHGLFSASLSCWSRLSNRDSRHIGGLTATEYNLGRLYEVFNKGDKAQDCYQKALENCQKAFGESHPKTEKIRESLTNLTREV